MFFVPRQREQGMPGTQACPQPCVQMKKARKQVTAGSPEYSGIPRAAGFNGLLRGLPGDRAFLPPSPRNAKHCHELIPASRYQDATTSPSATMRIRLLRHRVHRIFRPTFSDDRETPLVRAEDARRSARDLPDVTRKNICDELTRRANQVRFG